MAAEGAPRALQTSVLPTISGGNSVARLSRLYDIVRSLASITQLDLLLHQIAASAADMLEAKGSALLLVDTATQRLNSVVTTGRETAGFKNITLGIDDLSVEGTVAAQGASRTENLVGYSSYLYGQAGQLIERKAEKLICVPLKVQERVTGVLEVLDKLTGADFNGDDLKLLEALADTAAVAIENVRLYEEERRQARRVAEAYQELQKTYKGTLLALTGLLDERDNSTHGHSLRVVRFTLRLAREMGIVDPEHLRYIEQGALLHDIGKVGVRDAVLYKETHLDDDEWKEMRQHPEIGYRMLKGIEFLEESMKVVRFHHERWDGSGYPLGLKGEEIPLEARIFAIADTFDAITSDRPYSGARTYEQAAAVFQRNSGTLFDPAAVNAFLRVPREEWQAIRDAVAMESGQTGFLKFL